MTAVALVQSLLSTRGRRDSGWGQCLKGCRYVGTRLLQNRHGRLLSMESTQAWEAKESWAGGPCADMFPFIFSVGTDHLLQRILLSAAENWASFQCLTLGPCLFLGFNSKVYISVPRVTMGRVHLRLGVYNTSIWFYSSFYCQWSANKYKPPGSSKLCFSLIWNELHSELCWLHLPDDNGNLGSSLSGWLYKAGGVRWIPPQVPTRTISWAEQSPVDSGPGSGSRSRFRLLACRCSHPPLQLKHSTHHPLLPRDLGKNWGEWGDTVMGTQIWRRWKGWGTCKGTKEAEKKLLCSYWDGEHRGEFQIL